MQPRCVSNIPFIAENGIVLVIFIPRFTKRLSTCAGLKGIEVCLRVLALLLVIKLTCFLYPVSPLRKTEFVLDFYSDR